MHPPPPPPTKKKTAQCHVVAPADIHPQLFKGANRTFSKIPWKKAEEARHNKERSPAEEKRRLTRAVARDRRRQKAILEVCVGMGVGMRAWRGQGGRGLPGRLSCYHWVGESVALCWQTILRLCLPLATTRPARPPACLPARPPACLPLICVTIRLK
jgi:hypothetical protein